MTRIALSPLAEVASLHDEVDRFLRAGTNGMASAWMPPMDIAESEDAWLFTLELPGLTKQDITVTVEDGVLSVGGERHRPGTEEGSEADGVNWRRVERRMGSFHRNIRLPERIDPDKVEASMRDGLLAIRVAKAEEAKPRTIEIQ